MPFWENKYFLTFVLCKVSLNKIITLRIYFDIKKYTEIHKILSANMWFLLRKLPLIKLHKNNINLNWTVFKF